MRARIVKGMRTAARLAGLSTALLAPPALAQVCDVQKPATAALERFHNNGDGTLTDRRAGLMWQRCSAGQTYEPKSQSCRGGAVMLGWADHREWPARVNRGEAGQTLGFSDWRLPTTRELMGIVEGRCKMPSIDERAFPGTPTGLYWTRVADAELMGFVYLVYFMDGSEQIADKALGKFYLRLVRDVQPGDPRRR